MQHIKEPIWCAVGLDVIVDPTTTDSIVDEEIDF